MALPSSKARAASVIVRISVTSRRRVERHRDIECCGIGLERPLHRPAQRGIGGADLGEFIVRNLMP